MRQVICWFVYIGKNPRFTAFLDSNLHTRLAIVTENEFGLAFPTRNLPKKFRPDPSTFYLVIVVTNKETDKQTDRQTNAGDYIIPRESFRGDSNKSLQNLQREEASPPAAILRITLRISTASKPGYAQVCPSSMMNYQLGIRAPANSRFPGTPRLDILNGILISIAVLYDSLTCPTHRRRQTDQSSGIRRE